MEQVETEGKSNLELRTYKFGESLHTIYLLVLAHIQSLGTDPTTTRSRLLWPLPSRTEPIRY